MESVSCNLQTGSDFPQLASTCSDCKIGGKCVVYSRLKCEHAFTHLTCTKKDSVFLEMNKNSDMETQNMTKPAIIQLFK